MGSALDGSGINNCVKHAIAITGNLYRRPANINNTLIRLELALWGAQQRGRRNGKNHIKYDDKRGDGVVGWCEV